MEDYYKNAVIPPPEDDLFYEGNTRNTRIVVDSKERNLILFPEPNNYEIVFDDDINDVVSVKLINIQLPMNTYLINKFDGSYFIDFDYNLGLDYLRLSTINSEQNFLDKNKQFFATNKCNGNTSFSSLIKMRESIHHE